MVSVVKVEEVKDFLVAVCYLKLTYFRFPAGFSEYRGNVVWK